MHSNKKSRKDIKDILSQNSSVPMGGTGELTECGSNKS